MAGAARPPTQGRSRPGFGGERGETRVDKNQHSFERMFKRQCARACPGVLGYTGTYPRVPTHSDHSDRLQGTFSKIVDLVRPPRPHARTRTAATARRVGPFL